MNNHIISGRLGEDPTIRYTSSGGAVANFSVCTEEAYKDKEGEWKKDIQWHKVVCFGRRAETVGEYLHKGSKVVIAGESRTRSYEDKQGTKKYITEIHPKTLEFADDKPNGGSGYSAPAAPAEKKAESPFDKQPSAEIDNDDVPF